MPKGTVSFDGQARGDLINAIRTVLGLDPLREVGRTKGQRTLEDRKVNTILPRMMTYTGDGNRMMPKIGSGR